MPGDDCEICGAAAVVHSTALLRGAVRESHYCADHAVDVLPPDWLPIRFTQLVDQDDPSLEESLRKCAGAVESYRRFASNPKRCSPAQRRELAAAARKMLGDQSPLVVCLGLSILHRLGDEARGAGAAVRRLAEHPNADVRSAARLVLRAIDRPG